MLWFCGARGYMVCICVLCVFDANLFDAFISTVPRTPFSSIIQIHIYINIYITTNTQVPFIVKQSNFGILMVRQHAYDTTYTSPPFYDTRLVYLHGRVNLFTGSSLFGSIAERRNFPPNNGANRQFPQNGSFRAEGGDVRPGVPAMNLAGNRRARAFSNGGGIYMMSFGIPWQRDSQAAAHTNAIGVALVQPAVVLTPPLPPPSVMHVPNRCPTKGCLRVWFNMKLPHASLSPENATQRNVALFAQTVRCLHWGGSVVWNQEECKLVNVSYLPANGSVEIQCVCDADGFVYADWTR